MKYLIFSLRPKHWVKNFLLFFPLIFGEKLFLPAVTIKIIIAFSLFCLASAAVYLINDIIDAKKDRLHPAKRLRPIASGKLNLKQAKIAVLIFVFLSTFFAFYLNTTFGWIIAGYILFNIIYSRYLKEAVIIDVFCIGAFFVLRLLAGSVIAQVSLSYWIIIMTVLLALFLGLNKRRQELEMLEHKAALHRHVLCRYSSYFIDQMILIITSSLVVFYTMYTIDARTVKEFGSKRLLYTIPFVYYGIFRYLYLIHKLKKDGDPTRIIFSDSKSQINIFLWLIVCISVIYF